MTAPDGRRELVSQGTRRAVRDLMSNTVLREIDQMWQDEKFAPGPEPDPPVGGQRVSLFQSYLTPLIGPTPATSAGRSGGGRPARLPAREPDQRRTPIRA